MHTEETTASAPHHGRSRAGNRVLLATGLGAGLAAVAGLGLLQASAGAAAPQTATPAAEARSMPDMDHSSGKAAAADHTIEIKNYKFAQPKLTVKVGDTVKWVNEDSAPHTVTTTSGPAKFDSGTLQKGDSWSYTFTKAGTYQY